jgi:hypothetical protein
MVVVKHVRGISRLLIHNAEALRHAVQVMIKSTRNEKVFSDNVLQIFVFNVLQDLITKLGIVRTR